MRNPCSYNNYILSRSWVNSIVQLVMYVRSMACWRYISLGHTLLSLILLKDNSKAMCWALADLLWGVAAKLSRIDRLEAENVVKASWSWPKQGAWWILAYNLSRVVWYPLSLYPFDRSESAAQIRGQRSPIPFWYPTKAKTRSQSSFKISWHFCPSLPRHSILCIWCHPCLLTLVFCLPRCSRFTSLCSSASLSVIRSGFWVLGLQTTLTQARDQMCLRTVRVKPATWYSTLGTSKG